MIYTSQYNITLEKIIGRLLPFFTRGRKLFLLIHGSLSPLKKLHERFLVWAQNKHTEARLTFQVMSIEWHLNKELKNFFANPEDVFKIDLYAHKSYKLYLEGYAISGGKDYSDYKTIIKSPQEAVIVGTKPITFELKGGLEIEEIYSEKEASLLLNDNTIGSEAETIRYNSVTFSGSDLDKIKGKTIVGLSVSGVAPEYKTIFIKGCEPLSPNYLYKIDEENENQAHAYFRDELTGSTTNRFNISAPNVKEGYDIEDYVNAIKKILAKYSLIRRYKIIIQDL